MRSSPDVATDAARARVTALEAAISALGGADGAALKSLQEALQKAKQSQSAPCSISWGEIGRVPPIHQACQETPTRIC